MFLYATVVWLGQSLLIYTKPIWSVITGCWTVSTQPDDRDWNHVQNVAGQLASDLGVQLAVDIASSSVGPSLARVSVWQEIRLFLSLSSGCELAPIRDVSVVCSAPFERACAGLRWFHSLQSQLLTRISATDNSETAQSCRRFDKLMYSDSCCLTQWTTLGISTLWIVSDNVDLICAGRQLWWNDKNASDTVCYVALSIRLL